MTTNETMNIDANDEARRDHERTRREAGFTLVEMMAVLFIIGVLGTMIFVAVRPGLDNANATKAGADIDALVQASEMYRLTLGEYPRELSDLSTAPRDPRIADRYPQGGFLRKSLSRDPWGREYVYRYPGENGEFDILTFGRDGEPGGEGQDADIASWNR